MYMYLFYGIRAALEMLIVCHKQGGALKCPPKKFYPGYQFQRDFENYQQENGNIIMGEFKIDQCYLKRGNDIT